MVDEDIQQQKEELKAQREEMAMLNQKLQDKVNRFTYRYHFICNLN